VRALLDADAEADGLADIRGFLADSAARLGRGPAG
jgi:hypothetical protein